MQRTELLEQISEHFKVIKQAIVTRSNQAGSLPYSQKVVLFMLDKDPGIHVKTMAAKLFISPSAVSQIIDALLQDALITKQPSQTDRRLATFSLTDVGRRTLAQAQAEHIASLEAICQAIPDADLEHFLRTLQAITQTIQGDVS